MNDDKSTKTVGIGFFGILALIFITLKLLGKIAWSWIWVLAPLWVPTAIALVVVIIAAIIYAVIK
jgi:hypothetical protein